MRKKYFLDKKRGVAITFLIYITLKLIKLGKIKKIFLPEVSYPIYLRSKTSDISAFRQIFVHKGYNIDLDFYPETIIDAGANIGLAAIYFANKYKKANVISIEPEKSNYSMLTKNVDKYKNVHSLKRALSNNSNQEISVINRGYGLWGFVTESKEISKDDIVVDSVKTITIDEIMNENGLEYIDLLKIDIEGAERELFESNFEKWLPKIRCLIIELHDRIKIGSSKNFFKAISKYDFLYFHKGDNLVFLNRSKELQTKDMAN